MPQESAPPADQVGLCVVLFGAFRVWRDGTEVDLGPPLNQTILGTLVVARGASVTVAELVDTIWGADPPPSAVNLIHRSIGRLRRALQSGLAPRDSGSWLVAAPGGYRFAYLDARSDLADFDRLVAEAHSATPGDRAARLAEALAVARAGPFTGASAALLGKPAVVAVQQRRVQVAAEAVDAAVAAGSGIEVVLDEAEQVAADHALDERLQAAVLRGLAASGRRADGLARYQQIRLRLRDELALEPGEDLRTAHQMLLADPDPDARQDSSSSRTPTPPRQLPPDVAGFVDRGDVADRLAALALRLEDAQDLGRAVSVVTISGMAGIGKTTLAVHWARQVAAAYPDGQVYVSLRGYDRQVDPVPPGDALRSLLLSLDIPVNVDGVGDVEARSARFRSAVADKRLLMVLDNARDADQVRPLLPTGPGSLVLVTSRDQLRGLVSREGALPILLDRLDDEDARHLLVTRLGRRRVEGQSGVVDRIVARCSGLPLALSMVAARAVLDPDRPLDRVVDDVSSAPRRLDSFGRPAGDDLRSVLAGSYRTLGTSAQRFLRHLAAHPAGAISTAAAASTAGVDRATAASLAEELVAASMLLRAARGRFALHDLVRPYAGELLDAEGERTGAESRLVGHYVSSVRNAYLTFGRPPLVDAAPAPGDVHPEHFPGGPFSTFDWYRRERDVLVLLTQLALDRGWLRQASLLALDARPMAHETDSPADRLAGMSVPLRAAERLGDPVLLAEVHRDLGSSYGLLDDGENSVRHLDYTLQYYRTTGEAAGMSNVLRVLSFLSQRADARDDALRFAEEAVEWAEKSVDLGSLCFALVMLCNVHLSRQDWAPGVSLARRAVALARANDMPFEELVALGNLTFAGLRLERYEEVVDAGERILDLAGEYEGIERLTVVLPQMALAYLRLGNLRRAEELVGRWHLLFDTGFTSAGFIFDDELTEAHQLVHEVEEALRSDGH